MSYTPPNSPYNVLEPPESPMKLKRNKVRRNTFKPNELFTNIENPTANLNRICGYINDENSHTITCKSLTEGGYGEIYKCNLICDNREITDIVIKKEYKYVKTDYNHDNELKFMRRYCSDNKGREREYFAQLLFWRVNTNDKKIELGIKKYSSSLDPSDTSLNNIDIKTHIDNIHDMVIESISKLHKLHYVHLDIKPGNILIDYNKNNDKIINVVLADFGLIHKTSNPHFTSVKKIRTIQDGTPMIWLPEPTIYIINNNILLLKEFAEFRDRWAWAISLCYLLNYYNVEIFNWIYLLTNPGEDPYIEYRCGIYISEFISNKKLRLQTIQFLNSIQDSHVNIIKYIKDTILMLPKFYLQTEQTAGGANKIIKYNDKTYKVHKNKANEQYINVNKTKVFLSSIRRQYRYIKN